MWGKKQGWSDYVRSPPAIAGSADEEEGSLWKLEKGRKHSPLEPTERSSSANILILPQWDLGHTANFRSVR